ncbi:hypothetical protein PMAYCL1PPCAC_13808, partial [Pristionchus mayeri]
FPSRSSSPRTYPSCSQNSSTPPCAWIQACWASFRFCMLRGENKHHLETRFHLIADFRSPKRDYRAAHSERMVSIPKTSADRHCVGWATLGTVIMHW